jgi:hypothetical protein
MKNQFLVILSVLLVFISCDNTRDSTRSRKDAHEASAVHPEIDIWCPFGHADLLQRSCDSVFVFTEEYGNAGVYTLIINPNSAKHYNGMFYGTDSLNALYNVIGDTHEPKVFFEGIAFKVNADKINEIEKRLDKLLDETGSDSYAEMLDGSSFVVTYTGRTRRVNTGPMIARWEEYSAFLFDSILRPYRKLKEKGRREVELNHR